MATTKSKSASNPSTPKAAATKTASVAKKPAAAKAAVAVKKPAAAKPNKISPEERYRMVEVAAYFLAERNSFAGSPVAYWTAAESQISTLLGKK